MEPTDSPAPSAEPTPAAAPAAPEPSAAPAAPSAPAGPFPTAGAPAAPAEPSSPPADPNQAPTSVFELPEGVDPATVKLPEGSKYKTVGEALRATNEAIAARDRANEQLKGFRGAPVDQQGNPVPYELPVPEGFEEAIDREDPFYGKFQETMRRHNASQDVVNELMPDFVQYMQDVFKGNVERDQAALAAHYGGTTQRDAVQGQVAQWVAEQTRDPQTGAADPETMRLLQEVGVLAGQSATLLLERLSGAANRATVSPTIKDDVPASNLGEMRKDPGLLSDPRKMGEFERQIQANTPKKQGGGASVVLPQGAQPARPGS